MPYGFFTIHPLTSLYNLNPSKIISKLDLILSFNCILSILGIYAASVYCEDDYIKLSNSKFFITLFVYLFILYSFVKLFIN